MKILVSTILTAFFLLSPQTAESVNIPYQAETAVVTAYSSTPGQTDSTPFITASGTHVHEGTLACPRAIPFGTKVLIQGVEYTCEDRMALRYDGRFDIWMASTSQAIAWGMKTVEVRVELSMPIPSRHNRVADAIP